MSKIATGIQILKGEGIEGVFSTIQNYHLPQARMRFRKRFRSFLTARLGWALDRKKTIKIDDCNFSLDSPLVKRQHKLELLFDEYELPERQAIKRFLDPSLPIVEMGGAIGVVSCLANKKLNDPSRHAVVEANPLLLPLLEENKQRNNCQFQILNAAVGYGAPTVEFKVYADYLASSAHTADYSHLAPERRSVIEARANAQSFQTVGAKAVSLQAILDKYDFPRCTLICDIEGTEKDLVQNEAEVLRQRVEMIVMEIHAYALSRKGVREVVAQIQNLGFELLYDDSDTFVFKRRP